jgi:hypothetical protein
MKKPTRVLLSIEPQMCKELIRHNLAGHADVEIVGESCNYIECLALLAQQQVHVWIHSSENDSDLAAMQTRAYEIAPELVIVRVNSEDPMATLQVQVSSMIELLDFTNQWKTGVASAYSL